MSHKSLERFCSMAALVLLLTSCKGLRQTVEVPVYIHDTSYVSKEVHDSTFIDHWHTIYQKGDTVFVTDTEIKYRERVRVDTAYKYIEKPVTVTVTETKEVKKPLSWWEKTQQIGFWLLLSVAVVVVVWKVLKWRFANTFAK